MFPSFSTSYPLRAVDDAVAVMACGWGGSAVLPLVVSPPPTAQLHGVGQARSKQDPEEHDAREQFEDERVDALLRRVSHDFFPVGGVEEALVIESHRSAWRRAGDGVQREK